jgi:hypothetical protein
MKEANVSLVKSREAGYRAPEEVASRQHPRNVLLQRVVELKGVSKTYRSTAMIPAYRQPKNAAMKSGPVG